MRKTGDRFEVSASDLVGYLNCRHLTNLDRAVAEGTLGKPKAWSPLLEILADRGAAHESAYLDYLEKSGLMVVRIDGIEVSADAVAATLDAMKQGAAVIAQGALAHGGWVGRADVLRRVETPSIFGSWSYEALDTKLARETRAGTLSSFACIPTSSGKCRASRQSTCTSSCRGRISSRSGSGSPTMRLISAKLSAGC
jgi:uncharacterized protein